MSRMIQRKRRVSLKLNCRAKALFYGNSFDTRQEAEQDARERTWLTGKPYRAYRCSLCGAYHSGSDKQRKFRRGK